MRIRRSAIGLFLLATLFSNLQIQSASAVAFASGTPCAVIVSDSSNLTYSHNSGTRQCTYTFSYNATVRTITLPTNLVSATLSLTGARGGQGGERYNASATATPKVTTYSSTVTYVGQYSGTIPAASSKLIEINTGNIGSDGQNFPCDNNSHPGGIGGTSSYVSAVGGQGGSQGCGTPNNGEAGGTGGGGGGATVAVINTFKIIAGGGGGTGGTGRNRYDNANLAGAGASSTNSSNYVSGTNAGESGGDVLQMSNTGCTSNIGGGGGGLIGGYGGTIGVHICGTHVATAAGGGYPGLNSTSSVLTNTSTSYISKSTDTTDATAYGSAVIVLIYKGTTTATLTIPSGDLVYRQLKVLAITSSVAGKITFTSAGKVLPGCKNKAANSVNSYTVTCSLRPSTRNTMTITATLDPINSDYIGTVTSSAQLLVGKRTGPRT